MLFKFRCNSVYPSASDVEAHFDMPGCRPMSLRLPKPGPAVGETYDVEINGPGIAETLAPELAEARKALADAQAERDAARAELETARKALNPTS